VYVAEPGQPLRVGIVTAIAALDDHFVYDVSCDGVKLLAVSEEYVVLIDY
jgi:hypothetical protein